MHTNVPTTSKFTVHTQKIENTQFFFHLFMYHNCLPGLGEIQKYEYFILETSME